MPTKHSRHVTQPFGRRTSSVKSQGPMLVGSTTACHPTLRQDDFAWHSRESTPRQTCVPVIWWCTFCSLRVRIERSGQEWYISSVLYSQEFGLKILLKIIRLFTTAARTTTTAQMVRLCPFRTWRRQGGGVGTRDFDV